MLDKFNEILFQIAGNIIVTFLITKEKIQIVEMSYLRDEACRRVIFKGESQK